MEERLIYASAIDASIVTMPMQLSTPDLSIIGPQHLSSSYPLANEQCVSIGMVAKLDCQ